MRSTTLIAVDDKYSLAQLAMLHFDQPFLHLL